MVLSLVLGGPLHAALADEVGTPEPEATVETGQDGQQGEQPGDGDPEGEPTEVVDPTEVAEPTEIVDPVEETPTEVTDPTAEPTEPSGDEVETPEATVPDEATEEAPVMAPRSLAPQSEPQSIGVQSVSGTSLSPTSISVLPGASFPATLTISMSGPTAGGYSITRPSNAISFSNPSANGSGGLGRTCTGLRGPVTGNITGTYSLGVGSATCTISFTVNVSGSASVGTHVVSTSFGSITIQVVSPLTATGDEVSVQYAGTVSGAVTASGGSGVYSFALESGPATGTVTVYGDGIFTYTAGPGISGEDVSFVVTVTDTSSPAQSASATVTVHVGEQLTASADPISVTYTGTGTTTVVPSGGTPGYTYEVTAQGDKGEAEVDADGVVTYTANPNESGTDSFTVTVTDSGDQPEPQTTAVEVGVTIGEPLSVQDAWIYVAHNGSESGQIDAEGGAEPYAFEVDEQPTKGTVEIDEETGAFTYTALEGEYGDDSFTVTVTDSGDPVLSETATVFVKIDPAELTVETLELTLMAGQSVTGNLNDQVSGGVPPYTFTVDQEPEQGTLVLQSNGRFAYVANADATGTDSFTYTVVDSDESEVLLLAVTTGTVEITFSAQPVTPTPTVEPTTEPTATPSPTVEPTIEPTTTPDPTGTPSPTVEPTTPPTQAPSPTATPKATTAVTGLPSTGAGATGDALALGWLLASGALLALGGALTWRRQRVR